MKCKYKNLVLIILKVFQPYEKNGTAYSYTLSICQIQKVAYVMKGCYYIHK